MKDELWFQLIFVAIAVVFWLWRTIRKFKKRAEQSQQPAAPQSTEELEPEAEEPRSFIEELMEQSTVHDPVTVTAGLLELHSEISERLVRIRAMCNAPALKRFSRLLDESVGAQLETLRVELTQIRDEPPSRAADERTAEIESELEELRAICSVMARAVVEHLSEDTETGRERTVRVAQILFDRMEGIAGRSHERLTPPMLFAMGGAADLHPSVLSALARIGALPVDTHIGRHPHPLAWCAQAHHIAGWTLSRIPQLGAEIAGRTAAMLEALDYQAMEPHPLTVRLVFSDVVCTLMFGEHWIAALGSGWLDEDDGSVASRIALARRALTLADDQGDAESDPLDVQGEIFVRILADQNLSTLGETRLPSIAGLRYDHVEARRVEEAAAQMKAGQIRQTVPYTAVLAAMLCAQNHPEMVDAIADLLDDALGSSRDRGAGRPREIRDETAAADGSFIDPEAVRQAIVLAAAMRRPSLF